jgi:hypothetical protein
MKEIKLEDVYDARESKKAPDTENLTIEGPPVAKGKIVELECFYAYDHTTAAKTIRIGFDRNGTKYWIKQKPAATNEHGIAQNGKLVLVDGEKPIAMIESPTAADECYLVARGVYL